MIIKEIKFGSEEYNQEVALRDKILRKPLNLKFTKHKLDEEIAQHHFCAFDNGKIIGCLLMKPLQNSVIQMRQVAVDFDYQKNGIGKRLVNHCEIFAKNNGFKKIILHARDIAIPFYEKLGYKRIGNEFTEVTILHYEMEKDIE